MGSFVDGGGGSKGGPPSQSSPGTMDHSISSDNTSYDTVIENEPKSGNMSYASAANSNRSTSTRPMAMEQIKIISERLLFDFYVGDLSDLGPSLRTIDDITKVLVTCNKPSPDLACPLQGNGRMFVIGFLRSKKVSINSMVFQDIVWKFMPFAEFYLARKRREEENAKFFFETVTLFGYPDATLSDVATMFEPFGADIAPHCLDVKPVLTPSGVWNLAIRVVLKIERGKTIPGYIKVVMREKSETEEEYSVNVQVEAGILRGSIWCRLCCGEGHKGFDCPSKKFEVPVASSPATEVPPIKRAQLRYPAARKTVLEHLPKKDYKALKDVASKYQTVTHFGRGHKTDFSILSNQSFVDVKIDGKVYKSNEHYALSMLAAQSSKYNFLQPAIESSSNIKLLMKNADPVRNEYENNVGKKELLMFQFLKRANHEKYSQNQDARTILMTTCGTRLAETISEKASHFWSTGKNIDDKDADSVSTWPGSNVMGDLLTVIRDGFIAKQKRGHSNSPSGSSPSEQKLRSD